MFKPTCILQQFNANNHYCVYFYIKLDVSQCKFFSNLGIGIFFQHTVNILVRKNIILQSKIKIILKVVKLIMVENKRIILNQHFVFHRAVVRKHWKNLVKVYCYYWIDLTFITKPVKLCYSFIQNFFQMPAICHLSLELELCIFSSDDVSNRS